MDGLRRESLDDGRPLLCAHGELDARDVDQLRAELRALVRGSTEVVVDLSRITYLDSSILAVLISESMEADELGRRLTLVTGENGLLRSFELKGLMQVMHIVHAVRDA